MFYELENKIIKYDKSRANTRATTCYNPDWIFYQDNSNNHIIL